MTTLEDAGLVTLTQFAVLKDRGERTVRRWRKIDPKFPAPVVGAKQPLWRITDAKAYSPPYGRGKAA